MRDEHVNSNLARLLARLASRSAVIGVAGLGASGLDTCLRYAARGFPVIGFDTDAAKLACLERGESPSRHIAPADIARARAAGFEASGDFARSASADALLICVPTPLNAYREPDLSYVLATFDAILPHLRPGQVIALESATYPGTTDEELRPRLAAQGLAIGQEVFLVYSPTLGGAAAPSGAQRVAQAGAKACGADTQACLKAGVALYSAAIDTVLPVSSTRAAEMLRLVQNIERAVHLGLFNEMKIVADRMGIDIDEVLRAAGASPPASECAAAESFYLTWKARQYGLHTRLIELAGEIIEDMPHWVIGKLTDALNARSRPVKGSRVLVLGLARAGRDDAAGSPAREMIEILQAKGALVAYADPHVPALAATPQDPGAQQLMSIELSPQSLASFDAVLLATRHAEFDYDMIGQHARLIVDTLGVYLNPMPNLVKA